MSDGGKDEDNVLLQEFSKNARPTLAVYDKRRNWKMWCSALAGFACIGLFVSIPMILYYTLPVDLVNKVKVEDIMKHIDKFQDIADSYNDSRSWETGFNASVDYVYDQLIHRTDYRVEIRPFNVSTYTLVGTPILYQDMPIFVEFKFLDQFDVLVYSGTGNMTAPVQHVVSAGCDKDDFTDGRFTSGHVAMIVVGSCNYYEKAYNAWKYGNASGVLIYNDEFHAGIPWGILVGQPHIPLPVFGGTFALGQSLIDAGAIIHMEVGTYFNPISSKNIIAETLQGKDDAVIVVGSHLDGPETGPGINDNGSGSAANLQLAVEVYGTRLNRRIVNKIRFAFWGAEEEGFLGSISYLESLNATERDQIALYLNLDTIASPNFIHFLRNASGVWHTNHQLVHSSEKIMEVYSNYMDTQEIYYEYLEMGPESDYYPFMSASIPCGDTTTGQAEIKNMEEREYFGGLANTPCDPCAHMACDSVENIGLVGLSNQAHVAAYVLQYFATMTDIREYLNS